MNKNNSHETKPEQKQIESLIDVTSKLEEISALNSSLDKISALMKRTRIEDVLQNYSNPWRVIRINFLVGLARGVGMTLGTALFLGILIYVLSKSVAMPIIGEYIADLLEWIDTYRTF